MRQTRPAIGRERSSESDAERDVIVTRDADLKGANPMLNGLALLEPP